MENLTEVQTAESNLTVANIEAQTAAIETHSEVMQAEAAAQIAEANTRQAIAEARTDAAEEIVESEIEPENETEEIDEQWLTEKFLGVLSAVESLQSNLVPQLQMIAETSQQLLTIATEVQTILKMMNPSSQSTPQNLPEPTPIATENPESVEGENQAQKTNPEKKRRKI